MKQTEIGLIPDDWEVKRFKEFTNRITVGIANSATHAYTDHGIIMFRNQNIKENTLDLNDLIYIKKDFAQKYLNKQLYENDLLIARTGYPGTTCVVPKEFEGCQTFTTLIATPKSEVVNSDYIAYYFNSDFGKKLFSAAQIGGAQKNVNAHTLTNIIICIPPLPEQQRIAKALSDVDALISTTEKLIQKKKNIKQGAMQELLTGKKRLPGFAKSTRTKMTELGEIPEDWEVKKLGEIGYFIGGGTPDTNKSEYWKGSIPWISSSDISKNNIKDVFQTRFITETAIENSATKICPKNTILIVSRVGVGKLAISKKEVCTSQDFSNFICEQQNVEFVAYQLLPMMQNKSSDAQGTSIKGITSDEIQNMKITLPPKEEQTAIASVLSSMDKEIETLNTKLEKYRNLKTAMMQQLLTGKIRLV